MKGMFGSLVAGMVALTLGAGCGQKAEQSAAVSNRVEIAVTENGYEPATVTVAAGKPVTLVVTRQTDKTCATEVVMKEHNTQRSRHARARRLQSERIHPDHHDRHPCN